jgi:hypothetical protein
VASLTDKPKQQNHNHTGGHRSKKDHEHKDTCRPAKGKPELANFKTGGSIYVQMPKVIKAITISNDSESNEEREEELKQQTKDKQPVVETDEEVYDKNQDEEDDYMPYINRDTVDGFEVCFIGHLEEYT